MKRGILYSGLAIALVVTYQNCGKTGFENINDSNGDEMAEYSSQSLLQSSPQSPSQSTAQNFHSSLPATRQVDTSKIDFKSSIPKAVGSLSPSDYLIGDSTCSLPTLPNSDVLNESNGGLVSQYYQKYTECKIDLSWNDSPNLQPRRLRGFFANLQKDSISRGIDTTYAGKITLVLGGENSNASGSLWSHINGQPGEVEIRTVSSKCLQGAVRNAKGFCVSPNDPSALKCENNFRIGWADPYYNTTTAAGHSVFLVCAGVVNVSNVQVGSEVNIAADDVGVLSANYWLFGNGRASIRCEIDASGVPNWRITASNCK